MATYKQHQPPDVPTPLWKAMVNAGDKYDVPPLILAAIWRGESGSTYPNPYVNSQGYGGLFGTKEWNASTQQQADYAASIFHNALVVTQGNILEANGIYATGKPTPGLYGHAGLPTGTLKEYAKGGKYYVPVEQPSIGIVVPPVGSVGGLAGATAGVGLAAGAFGGITSVVDALKFLFSLRGLQVIGGGVLLLMGLYLLVRQVGLAADVPEPPGPIKTAALAAVPESAALKVGQVRERARSTRRAASGDQPTVRRSRTRTVHHYHPTGSPGEASMERRTRRDRITYDPSTSEIPF